MVSRCPHCSQSLNLTDAQKAKIENALSQLQAGTLKLTCPNCSKPMELKSDGSLAEVKKGVKGKGGKGINPPAPPDVQRLISAGVQDAEEIKDIPMALVLLKEGDMRDSIAGSIIELFFQPVYASSSEEAIEKMRFVNFSAVILHSGFEGGPLETSHFHQHMMKMAMSKRRYIFYVLIGPEFDTLYDLQALALSANLVVNDKEIDHLKTIIKKGQSDYNDLFGPWLSALKGHGNK